MPELLYRASEPTLQQANVGEQAYLPVSFLFDYCGVLIIAPATLYNEHCMEATHIISSHASRVCALGELCAP